MKGKARTGSTRSLMGISAADLSRLSRATTPAKPKRAAPKKKASPARTAATHDFFASGLLDPGKKR